MYGSRARGCGEWIRWKDIKGGGGVVLYHLGWCGLVSYRPTIYLPRSQQG